VAPNFWPLARRRHAPESSLAGRLSRPWPIESQMSQETITSRRQVEILNRLGLHMRPAEKFVTLALRYRSDVRVHYNGTKYNGKSILDLTSLAAECGTRLEIEAQGPDAAEAIEALAGLVLAQFHENENGEAIESRPSSESAR
jgi:phosphocarrier protein